MIARFIHHLRVERPVATETVAEARVRLGGRFPRGAVRRMTHLGMLLGATLEELAIGPDDAVVYATTFAETRSLEDFLTSFPGASPLLFQTSIHPGGIQQVLIGRQQPAARLWPLAGRARLTEQALLTALLEPAERVVFAGGEERGTWLVEHGMASGRAFAFGMLVTGEENGSVGRVCFLPEVTSSSPARESRDKIQGEVPALPSRATVEKSPTLDEFAEALAEHRPLAWQGINGRWQLEWS